MTTVRRNEVAALLEGLKTSSVPSGDVPPVVLTYVLAGDMPIFAGAANVAANSAGDA